MAAGACASGTLRTGADCSINPYYVVRGAVRLGDGVRVGAHTSVLGFNHTFSEPDQPVFHQPRASQGIVIGSDAWIGSQVVGLDGVAISSGAVVGLGAPADVRAQCDALDRLPWEEDTRGSGAWGRSTCATSSGS